MKKKVIIFVVLILIIIISLFVIKFNKVRKIINLMEQNSKKSNYYYIKEDILDSEIIISVKRKGNSLIYSYIGDSDFYFYYKINEGIVYVIDDENRIFYIKNLNEVDTEILVFPFYEYLTTDYSLKNKLKLVFEWKISNYDNDRYEITTKNNYKIIFDKNTGIALNATNINPNRKINKVIKEFEFDCITDEDVKFPDLSEYKEVSNVD